MPLIQVRVIKDVFSKEQKRQIISKLTDAMVSIEGESMRGVTWCVVEEVESGELRRLDTEYDSSYAWLTHQAVLSDQLFVDTALSTSRSVAPGLSA